MQTWKDGPPEDFTHDLLLIRHRKLAMPNGVVGIVIGVRVKAVFDEGDTWGQSATMARAPTRIGWYWVTPGKPIKLVKANELLDWSDYVYIPIQYE